MIRSKIRHAAVALLTLAFATAAQAHPKLLSSTPAEKSSVSRPKAFQLHFSERLVPKFSGAELIMTGMPGMASHAPMKMGELPAKVTSDGKTLVLTPKAPLSPGSYQLAWHVVSADTHRITGVVNFAVK